MNSSKEYSFFSKYYNATFEFFGYFITYLDSYFHYVVLIMWDSKTKLIPSGGKGFFVNWIRTYTNLNSHHVIGKNLLKGDVLFERMPFS